MEKGEFKRVFQISGFRTHPSLQDATAKRHILSLTWQRTPSQSKLLWLIESNYFRDVSNSHMVDWKSSKTRIWVEKSTCICRGLRRRIGEAAGVGTAMALRSCVVKRGNFATAVRGNESSHWGRTRQAVNFSIEITVLSHDEGCADTATVSNSTCQVSNPCGQSKCVEWRNNYYIARQVSLTRRTYKCLQNANFFG